ncbi:MAG TPA: dephospho-CoA kinase [Caldithrix sp.]|nr:dephospho-CoA kinase [Calditrichaceae bacterium]HEM49157.1 dephospho-CoA kinase [Caldithrix sp.]
MAQRYKNPLIVAVTGGIGSGQSTVCSFLKEWRCKVINADNKAKEVIQHDRKLQNELKSAFDRSIFRKDRTLDTKRLAEFAFKDEISTQKLNQLVHPRMVESLVEEMEQARFSGKYPIIVIDAALIYEISIENMFDAVIVVDAPVRLRERRVMERDKMTRNEFRSRLDKQIPLDDKVSWADYVIKNDGTIDNLKQKTRTIFNLLMQDHKTLAKN